MRLGSRGAGGKRAAPGWRAPLAGIGCALLGLAAATLAQAPDPLLAVHSADPLELARVVDRIGDGAVLERLGGETPIAVRIAAVRAAPWLHAPEAALPSLAEVASSRDPDLAPAAALAVVRIAEHLDRQDLDMREYDGDEIVRALPLLESLAADTTARADIRRGAAVAAGYLGPLAFAAPPAGGALERPIPPSTEPAP